MYLRSSFYIISARAYLQELGDHSNLTLTLTLAPNPNPNSNPTLTLTLTLPLPLPLARSWATTTAPT